MKNRVEQLDGLRGIFAVLVIAHHHNAFKDSLFYNNFFVINASLFVDFFFVLSGFVIALNYVGRIHSTGDFLTFLKKRFIRLYPLLFYTEIVFVIANLLGEHSPMKNVGGLGLSYYLYTSFDTLTFMGSSTVFGAWVSNNYPSWSISAEMISYIVFGLVVLLLPKIKYLSFAVIAVLSGLFIVSRGDYLLAYDYGFVRALLFFAGYFHAPAPEHQDVPFVSIRNSIPGLADTIDVSGASLGAEPVEIGFPPHILHRDRHFHQFNRHCNTNAEQQAFSISGKNLLLHLSQPCDCAHFCKHRSFPYPEISRNRGDVRNFITYLHFAHHFVFQFHLRIH
jgi:hypothetical protein